MKTKSLVKNLLLLLVLALPTTTLSARDRFEQWLDEVLWVASAEELKSFKQLVTAEDREAFSEQFWKKRDPSPDTLRNEYKEEHYRRYQYASENFHEGVPGWRGDRGKVYIIHGAPDQIENRDLPTEGRRGTSRKRSSIVWTYYQMPNSRYFKGRMVLVFQANIGLTEQDFTLGESRFAQDKARQLYSNAGTRASDMGELAVRYRLVTAGPPTGLSGRGGDIPSSGLGEYARFVEDIFRSPGDILEEEIERRQASQSKLREQIAMAVSFDQLPLYMSTSSFAHAEESKLSVSWQIPVSEIELRKEAGVHLAKVDLMAQIRNGSGQIIDEFFKSFDLLYTDPKQSTAPGNSIRYLNEFRLPPGDYTLTSIVQDMNSHRVGTLTRDVSCPSLIDAGFLMSDVVLSTSVSQASPGVEVGEDLIVDGWQVVPEPDLTFNSSERMVLLFKLYNAQEKAGSPDVIVSYDFLRGDQVARRSGPQPITSYAERDLGSVTFSSVIDLAHLTPGEYRLQVNAVDRNGGKFAYRRIALEIQ